MLRHVLVAGAAVALALPATAPAATPVKSKSHRVTGGPTGLTLDPAAVANLQSMGVAMSGGAPATTAGSVLTFPLKPGGTVKTKGNRVLSGKIGHLGTLAMTQGTVSITLSDPTVNFGSAPTFTGALGGLPVAIGDLSFKSAKTRVTAKSLKITGIGVKLTSLAANSMNATFGVAGFKAGDPIGKANLTATYKK